MGEDEKASFAWAQLDRDTAQVLALIPGDRVHVLADESGPSGGPTLPVSGEPTTAVGPS